MASGTKSFVLNRESDFTEKSILKNIKFKNDFLIASNLTGENGVYISTCFDSEENETIWHRLRINAFLPKSGIIKLKVYASDTFDIFIPSVTTKGKVKININDYILDKDIDINRKLDMFDHIGAKVYTNPTDILLFAHKGRYLWICFELINHESEPVSISRIKIEFPKVSFVNYLPEIYRSTPGADNFLERFLGIFQSIYVDLEDCIDLIPLKFDNEQMSKEFLEWLAGWFSIKDLPIWGEKKLRGLLKTAVKIYKIKGTKTSVARIVKEYAGIEPIIVEQFDIKNNENYYKNKDRLEELFGDNGYIFTIILSNKYVKTSEKYVELLRVINGVKPIDSICNLVILSNEIYLDHHCYMGINSYIAKNYNLVLDQSQKDINTLMLVNKVD